MYNTAYSMLYTPIRLLFSMEALWNSRLRGLHAACVWQVRGMAYGTTNGEDRGASGTGLAVVIAPMLKVLDEMYRAQDQMMK